MAKKQMLCTLGHQDIPVAQSQPLFEVDLLQTNILIFGAPMSGKTNLINLLVNILHKKYTIEDEQIFILDFGGSLMRLENMPLVAAYFDNANEEYVKRVFNLIEDQLKKNISILKAANYIEYGKNLIHTTLFIDNINAFIDEPRYAAYHEKLAKLCRDGLSKGITIVLSASSYKGLSTYINNFKQKIALEMPADSYSDIFGYKVIPVGNNPGHGYANITVKPHINDLTASFPLQIPYELQINLADEAEDRNFQMHLYNKFGYKSVTKYRRFPEELTEPQCCKFLGIRSDILPSPSDDATVVGLDYNQCQPYEIDFDMTHVFGIYGKKQFGKTNLLCRLLRHYLDKEDNPYRFVFFDDGREQLRVFGKHLEDKRNKHIKDYQDEVISFSEFQGPFEPERIEQRVVRLSPMQHFVKWLHENFMDISNIEEKGKSAIEYVFGDKAKILSHINEKENTHYIFILQSKLLYIQSPAAKIFMEHILPFMAARAKEKHWVFIFSDIKNINDESIRENLNLNIETAFLLDSIAEFVSERGRRSVFGSMDIKTLKEEYAPCELGDGYVYMIEEDSLKKLKFIKDEGWAQDG